LFILPLQFILSTTFFLIANLIHDHFLMPEPLLKKLHDLTLSPPSLSTAFFRNCIALWTNDDLARADLLSHDKQIMHSPGNILWVKTVFFTC
jgi:hypothetical protein